MRNSKIKKYILLFILLFISAILLSGCTSNDDTDKSKTIFKTDYEQGINGDRFINIDDIVKIDDYTYNLFFTTIIELKITYIRTYPKSKNHAGVEGVKKFYSYLPESTSYNASTDILPNTYFEANTQHKIELTFTQQEITEFGWFDTLLINDFGARTYYNITNKDSFIIGFSADTNYYSRNYLLNTCVEKPVDPVKTGYTFYGWYTGTYENPYIKLFDFDEKLTHEHDNYISLSALFA